jgi:hypothetical protein
MFDQGSSQCVTYRTILPWMAQETQYCNLRYILGTVYSGNTDASEISPKRRQYDISSILGILRAQTNRCRLYHVSNARDRVSRLFGGGVLSRT